jgi:dTDP-4-amino-4,6-dideoxygalactose transaminase
MKKIIGGIFGITSAILNSEPNKFPFMHQDAKFLVNARSGINILSHLLKPPIVWMPSYLCDVMLEAVTGFNYRFFPVSEKLSIVDDLWVNQIGPGDLVIFVSYFGFPIDIDCATAVKTRGGWVLEDASQALLSSHICKNADFVVYSPRKHLGVPDGGVLVPRKSVDGWQSIELQEPPSKWWLKAYSAALLRRDFDHLGGDRDWFRLFQESDRSAPIGAYAMSELSRKMLLHGIDYSEIQRKRIENYRWLADELGQFAIFPELLSGVVPLGFPIRLKNRDYVRHELFKNDIYPPVHWDLGERVPAEFTASHILAKQMMTLPCDQRYDLDDMERMAEIILRIV